MRFLVPVVAVILSVAPTAVVAEEIVFSDFEVYEFDPSRFAPNDSKPTLYKINLVGKSDALWIEGNDYNYQWLTIVPHAGIQHVKLDRRRGNPFVDTGSWIGKQLAKAGDIRGWFTITFLDRKNQKREVVLLAPVNGDQALADFLSWKSTGTFASPEPSPPQPEATPAPDAIVQRDEMPSVSPPQSPEPANETAPARPVKLIDVMTVSEFRAAGLMKLTEAELTALDAWIGKYLAK
jgi:hypothetical protein